MRKITVKLNAKIHTLTVRVDEKVKVFDLEKYITTAGMDAQNEIADACRKYFSLNGSEEYSLWEALCPPNPAPTPAVLKNEKRKHNLHRN